MESTGELAWFRGEVVRAIVRPRSFARSLAREHFGLAGVLVVIGAGIAFSLTIDLVVLAAKGISPESFVNRLIFAAFLLGARLAVSVAVVAVVVFLGTRVALRRDLTLDQSFNAVAFAFAPLIVAPLPALVALFRTESRIGRRPHPPHRRAPSARWPRAQRAGDPPVARSLLWRSSLLLRAGRSCSAIRSRRYG